MTTLAGDDLTGVRDNPSSDLCPDLCRDHGRGQRDCDAMSSILFVLRAGAYENLDQGPDGIHPPTDGSKPLRRYSTRDSRYSRGRRHDNSDVRNKLYRTWKMPLRRPAHTN